MSMTRVIRFSLRSAVLGIVLSARISWALPHEGEVHEEPPFATFDEWAAPYLDGTTSPESATDTEHGLVLAKARRSALVRLLATDPQLAIERALPESLHERLPAAVRPFLERTVAGSAEYDVLAIDDFNPSTDQRKIRYQRT